MQLTITNNSASNPLTLDLSKYIRVEDGAGMDVANPAFTQRVYTRSLLKEGASLALTQFTEKELQFPLLLGPVGGLTGAPQTMGAVATLIAQINQVLETPGATCTWKPDGVSQATTFDIIVGQFEVAYSFRKEEAHWTEGNLRIFTQPFGRTASPRLYATASGVGPVLMITPYASNTSTQVIGASTQAAVAGYGGKSQGGMPSSGLFYWGSPSLAGDAPAQLLISYKAPLAAQATQVGRMPYMAVSMLPDQNYTPIITAAQFTTAGASVGADAVASQYLRTLWSAGYLASTSVFMKLGLPYAGEPAAPLSWVGSHRLFAIARASVQPQALTMFADSMFSRTTTATVYPGDWQLCDLGVYTYRASQGAQMVISNLGWTSPFPASDSVVADVTALITLPDNATWFFSPQALQTASTAQLYVGSNLITTNQVYIDDVISDQFLASGFAANQWPQQPPVGVLAKPRITQYTRGIVPRPDPKNGTPIIAILGIGQMNTPSTVFGPSAAWLNPQNLPAYAEISVQERARYVLP